MKFKYLKRIDWLIVAILLIGVIYRIAVTSGGNFIFNIDNSRDMLQVREIVVLHHLPLIGPTSGINGLFTGPLWFYILTIPFIISGGDPYANILLMDFFWFIGGYFLLSIMRKQGAGAFIATSALWIASNYLMLNSIFSLNPNPVVFLSPLYIYSLTRYLETGKLKFAFLVGCLGAFVWNLEMAFGIFFPFIILFSLIFAGKISYLKQKTFWIGVVGPIVLGILPQIFFELRHNFFMTRNVIQYVTQKQSLASTFSFADRVKSSKAIFLEGYHGTFLNQPLLIDLSLVIFLIITAALISRKIKKDYFLTVTILMILVPFVGFAIFPLLIQRWHVDASLASLIFLLGLALGAFSKLIWFKNYGKFITIIISIIIVGFSLTNMELNQNLKWDRPSSDPSEFKNQIAAIDYAYKSANGKDFKAYVYSPGIIDLPYQYNFWWYGQQTKYGYLPKDYTYLPNQPEYIKYKSRYSNGKNPPDSNLVILIKEPGNDKLEDLWKNSFTSTKLLKTEVVGPLTIETRQE